MNREPVVGRATAVLVTAVLLAAAVWGARAPRAVETGEVATPVCLNTAAPGELELLPGVGRALAERIVRSRDLDGAYRSVRDLDRVRGVGPAMLERIAPFVRP